MVGSLAFPGCGSRDAVVDVRAECVALRLCEVRRRVDEEVVRRVRDVNGEKFAVVVQCKKVQFVAVRVDIVEKQFERGLDCCVRHVVASVVEISCEFTR